MKKEARFSQKILSCVHKKRFGITIAIIIVASLILMRLDVRAIRFVEKANVRYNTILI